MADSPQKKKQFDDWRNQAFAERANREAARRRTELWQALNKWITQNGGWVVSLPSNPRLRIETRRDSNLASKLVQLSYAPRLCGVNTRLTSSGIIPIDILEIKLPG